MSDPFVLNREAVAEPFVATIGDVTLTMAHPGSIDQFALAELFSKADNITDTEFKVTVFRLAMELDELEKLRALRLSAKELDALYAAYFVYGGTDAGESPASSTS